VQSKTLAERRAWELMESAGRRADLSTINPSFILGPLLNQDPGISGALILRLLTGSVPAAPRFFLLVIDVRDVAAVHLAAMRAIRGRRENVLSPLRTIFRSCKWRR